MPAKERINKLFTKNPEEIRGYITGFVLFLGRGLARIFRKPQTPLSLTDSIAEEKTAYSHLYNTKEKTGIWRDYMIGLLLGAGIRYLVQPDFTVWTNYLPLILII